MSADTSSICSTLRSSRLGNIKRQPYWCLETDQIQVVLNDLKSCGSEFSFTAKDLSKFSSIIQCKSDIYTPSCSLRLSTGQENSGQIVDKLEISQQQETLKEKEPTILQQQEYVRQRLENAVLDSVKRNVEQRVHCLLKWSPEYGGSVSSRVPVARSTLPLIPTTAPLFSDRQNLVANALSDLKQHRQKCIGTRYVETAVSSGPVIHAEPIFTSTEDHDNLAVSPSTFSPTTETEQCIIAPSASDVIGSLPSAPSFEPLPSTSLQQPETSQLRSSQLAAKLDSLQQKLGENLCTAAGLLTQLQSVVDSCSVEDIDKAAACLHDGEVIRNKLQKLVDEVQKLIANGGGAIAEKTIEQWQLKGNMYLESLRRYLTVAQDRFSVRKQLVPLAAAITGYRDNNRDDSFSFRRRSSAQDSTQSGSVAVERLERKRSSDKTTARIAPLQAPLSPAAIKPGPEHAERRTHSESTGHHFSEHVSEGSELLQRVQERLLAMQNKVAIVSTDPRLKEIRFSLSKAVNIPVNAISSSDEPLHWKLHYYNLHALLSGIKVNVGLKVVSVSLHPDALPFCMHLLAKQLIKQAETVVSVHSKMAFPLALLSLGLWSDFPDFGVLLMDMLYSSCHHLIPCTLPPTDSTTGVDYLKALGFQVVDGELENLDSFTKRLSGLVRFFAALCITPVPPAPQLQRFKLHVDIRSLPSRPHPLHIECAWVLLHKFLSLPPAADVTTTVLCELLKTCGFILQAKYKGEFDKLLNLIKMRLLPPLEQISLGPSRASYVRLETLLTENSFEAPEGFIDTRFLLKLC